MVLRTNRRFALLWHGQVISQLGHQAFLIAAISFVQDITASPALVSMVLVLTTLPMVLLGPWGGTLADRLDRRTIIVSADAGRAALAGLLGLSLIDGTPPQAVHVILAVAALGGAVNAAFAPALYAIIPDLVDAPDVPSATALHQVSAQVAVLTGQAFGGLLYVTHGAAPMFLLNGAAFGYAALTAWLLPRVHRPPRTARRPALDALREGFTWVRQRRGMLHVIFAFAGVNCAFMPVLVLLPFHVRDALERGPEWYGYLLGASGAGALAGSTAAVAISARVRRRGAAVRACIGGIALGTALIATTTREGVAGAALFAVGLFASLINVLVVGSLQARIPADVRGRVMGLVVALSSAAAPVGMLLGGIGGDLWRDHVPVIFISCAVLILILSLGASRSPAFDATLDRPQ